MQHLTDAPVKQSVPQASSEAVEGHAVVRLAIAEMECPACADRIRNALLAHPAIVEVETDARAALACVWYDPARVSVREILGVVAVLGEGSQHRFLGVALDPTDQG